MPVPEFLDSNILIYAYDTGAPEKRSIAQNLLRQALRGRYVISTQVLAEFSTTLLHKISPLASTKSVIAILDTLSPIRVISPDPSLVRRAVEAHSKYGVHFYDGMIVAAAEKAGCKRIWSEDMNAGQEYFGARVENPFKPGKN